MIRNTSRPADEILPLFVRGIAGVAGYNAFNHFRHKWPGRVFGERRSDYWPLSGPGILESDIEDMDRLKRHFDQHDFSAVLNCGGSCKLKSCELDPERAWRVNVTGLENLLDVIEGTDVRLIHTSIDLVYSGTGDGNYLEDHPTDPVTVYGKTMVAAEELLLSRRPDSCILRISLPMGVSFNGHAGAIDWIQSRFKQDKPATLYYDEVRTPTYTDCLNNLFETVLTNELSGIFHAGGPRQLSLYEIGQIVNRVGGYDPNLLMGCLRREAGPIPPRAGNVTLDSSLLERTLGYAPFQDWPASPGFVPTAPDWHYDRPAGEERSPKVLSECLYEFPPGS